MQKEADVFLPLSGNKRDRGVHRPPCLSSSLFNLFEQSRLYACFLFIIFICAACVGTLTTIEKYRSTCVPVLYYMELALFTYCLLEFFVRLYASESRIRYCGLKGKRRFLYERYLIIDLIVLITYLILFLSYLTRAYESATFLLHGLRFLQLIRFIPLDRHIQSLPIISRIVWQYRRVLLASVYLCFLLLLPTAYLLWIVERFIETNGQYFFQTYTDSLWFTINSMATIGYGDTWPQTLIGRTLTSTLCCVGVVLWTLPAGIIAAGLTSIDEKRRKCALLRQPAARLILAHWRLRVLDEQSLTIPIEEQQRHRCKQFIARLNHARLYREFQQCRNSSNNEDIDPIRRDIHRILQHLQVIEERLSLVNDTHC